MSLRDPDKMLNVSKQFLDIKRKAVISVEKINVYWWTLWSAEPTPAYCYLTAAWPSSKAQQSYGLHCCVFAVWKTFWIELFGNPVCADDWCPSPDWKRCHQARVSVIQAEIVWSWICTSCSPAHIHPLSNLYPEGRVHSRCRQNSQMDSKRIWLWPT